MERTRNLSTAIKHETNKSTQTPTVGGKITSKETHQTPPPTKRTRIPTNNDYKQSGTLNS